MSLSQSTSASKSSRRRKPQATTPPGASGQARNFITMLLADFDDEHSPMHDPHQQELVVKSLLDCIDWGTVHTEALSRIFDTLLENELTAEEILKVAKREHVNTCACCRNRIAIKVLSQEAH